MKKVLLEVITPSKAAFSGEVSSVTVPGTDGNFQVLYNHAPIISSLEIGLVKVVEDNSEKEYSISGGTVEVLNNKVLLLAESFESADDIDVERANSAVKRAKDRLSSKAKDVDPMRAELALKRAINRINLKNRHV